MQQETEDKLWIARAEDAISLADKRYTTVSVGFLTPHLRNLIKSEVHKNRDIETIFYGGYDDAERTLYVCYPKDATPVLSEVISVIKISGRMTEELSHRDYLGSLMGIGMKREMIGDILTDDDGALIFVKPEIADYILLNLSKIGRFGVNTEIVNIDTIIVPKKETEEKTGTVSSLRMDCIVAFILNTSRKKSVEFINAERVECNFEKVTSVSSVVKEGDLLSVRGFGRFLVSKIGDRTRKDRIRIVVEHYI